MRAREDKRKRRYRKDLRGVEPNAIETVIDSDGNHTLKAAPETQMYWEEQLRRAGLAETQLSRAVGAGSTHKLLPMGNAQDIDGMVMQIALQAADHHVTLTKQKQRDLLWSKELEPVSST